MENQKPEDLVRFLGSFNFAFSLPPPAPTSQPQPGPSSAVDYTTPTPGGAQKKTRKRRRDSSEPGSTTEQSVCALEEGERSPKVRICEFTSNQQGAPEQEQEQRHQSPQVPQEELCQPTVSQQRETPQPLNAPQPVMWQHHTGCCAHCNGQAMYHEDQLYYPCGQVKETATISDHMWPYECENGELIWEVVLPPPTPLLDHEHSGKQTQSPAPWGRCTHCGGQALYQESMWHFSCGQVKELTPDHEITEDMLRPCEMENGEIVMDIEAPPPVPLAPMTEDTVDVDVHVPPRPRKPKKTLNPETYEIPRGFTLFRDKNWFSFKKRLGTKDDEVILEALKDHWWEMSTAEHYKYEKEAKRARQALYSLHPELMLQTLPCSTVNERKEQEGSPSLSSDSDSESDSDWDDEDYSDMLEAFALQTDI